MTKLQITQTIIAVGGLTVMTVGLLLLKNQLQKWGKVCYLPK